MRPRRVSERAMALAGGLAIALALGGCGMGEEAQTPPQIRLTPGAGGQVGSVVVRDAKIAFRGQVPDGVVYRPGDDVPLQLTVVNDGTEPDTLVAVRSPIATAGTVVGDARMPGGHAGRGGRIALGAALIVGWMADAVLAPTSTLLVALLTALLGGSILLNVFKEEVPSDRRSSFGWFLAGLVVYATLLGVVTAVGG
jgi:hypothetical protein